MVCKDCNLIYGNKNNGFRFGNNKSKFIILRPYPTRQECNGLPNTKQNIWLFNTLKELGFTENMYHIANMINCYPIKQITKDEIDICTPKLINVINGKPRLIMALGIDSYNYASGYNIHAVEQFTKTMINGTPIVIPNYTVGQAMYDNKIKQKFIKILYDVKSYYRTYIDISI